MSVYLHKWILNLSRNLSFVSSGAGQKHRGSRKLLSLFENAHSEAWRHNARIICKFAIKCTYICRSRGRVTHCRYSPFLSPSALSLSLRQSLQVCVQCERAQLTPRASFCRILIIQGSGYNCARCSRGGKIPLWLGHGKWKKKKELCGRMGAGCIYCCAGRVMDSLRNLMNLFIIFN